MTEVQKKPAKVLMREFTAEAVIACWRADATVSRLSADVLQDALQGCFFPHENRMQVLVGRRNRMASNALWDGNFELAKRYLMRFGLKQTDHTPKLPSGRRKGYSRGEQPHRIK